jgi:hypothetical protein
MALISIGGPRRLTALLRELALMTRPRVARADTVEKRPAKRHYPPRRERVIESAAMRREMYRL